MDRRRVSFTCFVLLLAGVAYLKRDSLLGPPPGQLSTSEANTRRLDVANLDQQRVARRTKREAELKECQTQAESLSQALTLKRAALKSSPDETAVAALNQETAQHDALLQRIKTIESELENAYYLTPAPSKSSRRSPAEKAALPYADEELVELEAEPVNVRNRLSEKTDPLLAAGNFAELDRIAAQLRSSKAQCANGVWHLRCFYDGFAMLSDFLPETAWTDRIATFQAWIKQYPDSITPRIALASVWDEWAWRARGGDYASDVPRKGWELFEERIKESAKVLEEARHLEEKCPGWWDLSQRIALAQSWDRARYNRLFADATYFDPLYTGFYTSMNNYLLPRWFGKPGECAAFAEQAANELGGEEGDILYARLVWRLHSMDTIKMGSITDGAGASWPRVRKGMEAILRRYPNSIAAASELCYLSCQHGERERMRQLFVQIGPFVDTTMYYDKTRFLQDRRVAFQE
jgi:TolA-binding protein